MPIIELSNLSLKIRNTQILSDVSFDVQDGEVICLLGPSGCGKTTTLRVIAGLEIIETGTVSIDGQIVSDRNTHIEPHKRRVGFLFQDLALFPHLTAEQNIKWGLADLDPETAQIRTNQLLDQISLSDLASKYPHELSGGEQQRVALARAQAPQPHLLLLDEPFSSLDANLRRAVRNETDQFLKAHRTTSIIVTHDPEEAMLIADRIVLMREGRVVQIGSPMEIYSNPKDAFAASFFGYINFFDGKSNGNSINTAVGKIPNNKFPEGMEVEVFIRPEGLKISAIQAITDQSIKVIVNSITYAGNATYIWIKVAGQQMDLPPILTRQTDDFNFKIGDQVKVEIDKKNTFVFSKK